MDDHFEQLTCVKGHDFGSVVIGHQKNVAQHVTFHHSHVQQFLYSLPFMDGWPYQNNLHIGIKVNYLSIMVSKFIIYHNENAVTHLSSVTIFGLEI